MAASFGDFSKEDEWEKHIDDELKQEELKKRIGKVPIYVLFHIRFMSFSSLVLKMPYLLFSLACFTLFCPLSTNSAQ